VTGNRLQDHVSILHCFQEDINITTILAYDTVSDLQFGYDS